MVFIMQALCYGAVQQNEVVQCRNRLFILAYYKQEGMGALIKTVGKEDLFYLLLLYLLAGLLDAPSSQSN